MRHNTIGFVAALLLAALCSPGFVSAQEAGDIDAPDIGATDTGVVETRSGAARITTEYFGMQRPDARRGPAAGASSAPARRLPLQDTAASAAGDSAIAVPLMTDTQPADSAEAAPASAGVRTPVRIIATLTATAAVTGLITLFVVRSRDEDGEGAKKIPDPPDPPGF